MTPSDGMHRATVLIGWGDFGREVLRRLLVTAALRDLLRWEVEGDDALVGERRLGGLQLLSVRDGGTDAEGAGGAPLFDDTDLEVLRDVEAQIRDLGTSGDAIAAEVEGAARRLLASPPGAREDADRLPGLDLVVVAHLRDRQTLGRFDAVMAAVFAALEKVGPLQRGLPSVGSMAAISVLDVDNYWHSSPDAGNLRHALAEKVGRWEADRHRGRMAFGRVYLSGEMARDTVRSPRVRGDEISLFLELLLFEGRRCDGLQRLFEPLPAQEPSVGTFGIRLFERNQALLRQLAAARFASGWLRYLAGDGAPDEERPSPSLAERLAAVSPPQLDALLGWEQVRTGLAGELQELEAELAAIPPERQDWSALVAACCQRRAERWRRRVDECAGRAAERLSAELAALPEALDAAITAALCDGHRPLPLGAVLADLVRLREAVKVTAPAVAARAPVDADPGRALEDLSRRYRRRREERPTTTQLRGLLAALALLASVGGGPFVRWALEDLPAPGAMTHPAVAGLLRAAKVAALPPAASSLVLLLACCFFFVLVGPAVRRRIERGDRRFDDPRQGRMIDALRATLREGGATYETMAAAAERGRRDLEVEAAGAVGVAMERAIRRLEELRRELLWLSEQLDRLLGLYGLDGDGMADDAELTGRDRTGIRRRAERAGDVAAILRPHPPEPALYRHLQAESRTFAGWRQPHRSAFLRPLEFLRVLSQRFQDDTDGSGGERERHELLAFLAHRNGPGLAFDWRQREGVPPADRLALLPTRWARLAGVRSGLLAAEVDPGRTIETADGARVYLITLQLGLRPALLEESA